MALARCREHGYALPEGRSYNYVAPVRFPVGYPTRSGIVCGRPRCARPARIFLTEEEQDNYKKGYRIFTFPGTDAVSVRLRRR